MSIVIETLKNDIDNIDMYLKDEVFFEGFWELLKAYPEVGVLL